MANDEKSTEPKSVSITGLFPAEVGIEIERRATERRKTGEKCTAHKVFVEEVTALFLPNHSNLIVNK